MPDQVARLLAILREPVRTMALIGVLTGLRVGEILGLRWQDGDFKQGELRVEQAVYRGSVGSPRLGEAGAPFHFPRCSFQP
jgi:integrase